MKRTKAVIMVVFIFLGFLVLFLVRPNTTGSSIKEITKDNVKIATFSICNQTGDITYCKDKIFASCNKTLIEVNDSFFYCNNKRYDLGNISLGETYLYNQTPRENKNLITAWAVSD